MSEQFRNEVIQEIQLNPTKGENMMLRVLCAPVEGKQYGNSYSRFVADEQEADQITKDFRAGDRVLIRWKDGNPYTNKFGKMVTPRDLVGMSVPSVDVNEDMQEDMGEGRGKYTSATERGLGATTAPKTAHPDKDTSIVRQATWKVTAWMIQAMATAGILGNTTEGVLEEAVAIAHTIEDDINR